ncbi:SAGA complex subunit spt20 [Schizosaccharomyces pombe]|uniref:SAGA complex subunit Spt20 n=1 Tax=Schizosaccharomyces pombe (strain 972 / ATCC 24843) TaxID=284812 RepID=SPT20_SCHPO|nr:SAGA complex subunit Spt20 [Schizosaccharomyces pombe]O14174.1 RecName: Full=SAGA complex subunit spt20 [Schizosaccharomyces pombe 972h-]CAB11282.1 SAGA complex subunit Spt20 [Schizosaccharomyces pombe]|eukprot:NP_001342846.1 SAGA complex subunit Spt20 [Schizosaccharomyces pombe]
MERNNGLGDYTYRYHGKELSLDDFQNKQGIESSDDAFLSKIYENVSNFNVPRKLHDIEHKFSKEEPSLILHIHKFHFRFEQQDGAFTYNGPVKSILQYIRMELIPPDCLEVFRNSDVKFYDGCLTVRIIDHRQSPSADQTVQPQPGSTNQQQQNNTNPINNQPEDTKPNTNSPPVYHTVLRPTPETLWQDLCLLSESFANSLSDEAVLTLESNILLASEAPLFLTPAKSKAEMIQFMNQLADSAPPCTRKKPQGSAQLADEEAERLEKENLLLLMDDQRKRDFQPTFQRLQFIENVRRKRAILQQRQMQMQQQQKAQQQQSPKAQQPPAHLVQSAPVQRKTTPKIQRLPPSSIQIPPPKPMQKFPANAASSESPPNATGNFLPSGPVPANEPMLKRESVDLIKIRQLAILFQQRASQLKARGATREQITEILNRQAIAAGTDLATVMTVARNLHFQQLQMRQQQQQQQMKAER